MNTARYSVVNILVVAVLTAISCGAFAQSNAPSVSASEIALLRSQLETMRFFHDSFMSLAIWALGTAVAIVLALTVFSWFTNKSNYERDRDLIRQQTAALREELAGLLVQKIADARQELEKNLSGRQVAIRQELERALQPKLDKLHAEIGDATEVALELKAQLEMQEGDQAAGNQRYQWAIYKYCEVLDIFVKLRTDFYEAAEVLDKIGKIVKIAGISLDADTVNSTVQTLQRLPKQHHAVVEELIPRIKKALA